MKHLRLTLIMLTIFSICSIDAIERGRRGTREPGEPTRQQSGTQTRGRRTQTQPVTQPTTTEEPEQEEPTSPEQEAPTIPQAEEPQTQETVRLQGIKESSTFKEIYDLIKNLTLGYVFSGKQLSQTFINDTIAQVRTANLSNIELEFLLRTARDKFIESQLTGDNIKDLEILKTINQQIQDAKNQLNTPQVTTRRRRKVAAPTTPATTKPAAQTQTGGIQRGRTRRGQAYRGGM